MLAAIIFILSRNVLKKKESSATSLTHYHTMLHLDALKIYSYGKHCEKRRNCLQQAISPFLTMFSSLYCTYFSFKMHFKMSSAIGFNLNQSKILSSGFGIIRRDCFVKGLYRMMIKSIIVK